MIPLISKKTISVLAVLVISAVVLVGVVATSIPVAAKKALVIGGDYAFGDGTTSVKSVQVGDLDKFRVKDFALRNPPAFADGDFCSFSNMTIHIGADQLFTSPKKVRVDIRGFQLTVDASIDENGFHLNLLDVYRRLRQKWPDGVNRLESENDDRNESIVVLRLLTIYASQITGKVQLPGGKVHSISLALPELRIDNRATPLEGVPLSHCIEGTLLKVIQFSLQALSNDIDKWDLDQKEREALKLVLSSWSEEGVSEIVKDRVKGQVKKVLEDRLPSGLKDLLGGEKSSED